MTGLLVAHNHYDRRTAEVSSICVVQSDPLIYISDNILSDDWCSPFVAYGEGIVVITGGNITVRYRLLEHKPEGYWSAQRIDRNGEPPRNCDYGVGAA